MGAIAGSMPAGGTNRVEIAVCSIPGLLAMKGRDVRSRHKQKDAHDIYCRIRNYPDGIASLVEACRPLLVHSRAINGYRFIAEKFDSVEGYGPTCVRKFVEQTAILGDRSPEQWRQDAFGQADAWLRGLGLRG